MTASPANPEERILQYQAQMEDILHWAGLGPWRWEAETGLFKIGGDFLLRFGFTPEALLPLTVDRWLAMIHTEDAARLRDAFYALLSGKTDSFDQVYRMENPLGTEISFHARGGVTRRDEQGRPTRISGTIQDVTEGKRLENLFRRRDHLLAVSNDAARILLDADVTSFDRRIQEVLQRLGRETEVDRVHIWKNKITEDGRLYGTLAYEWSPEVESLQGSEYTVGVSYDEKFPSWKNVLLTGDCVNSLVRDTSPAEQTQLVALGIRSILVAPILFKGEFWGFIAFNDCRRERIWNDSETEILQSAGILIAGAVTRQMTETALETEQGILRRIFETSPTGVVITTDGRVVRANREFLRLFGQGIGDLIFPAYVNLSVREAVLKELDEKGAIFNRNQQFYGRDGGIREILTTYQKIDYLGNPSLLCWAVDITDLKNTEKALILARDMAEVATRAKSDFLARMSHEIRTPMNAILGMNYLCLQTELNDKQRDYLQKAQNATTSLLRIIDDVLDFSRIETGRLELEETPFRLSDILREVVDIVEYAAQGKGLAIKTQVEPSVHGDLLGDPVRLRQVLLNLMNNAVKFTEQGEVVLTVVGVDSETTALDDYHYTTLFFTVRDTGIGMSPEQIKQLFESFSQVDGTATRKYGGSGLGLAISKNLVELMGGTLGVESIFGAGTTFHFRVTFKKAGPLLQALASIDLNQRRVLVVDDDASSRDILKTLLISLNIRVTTVDSGEAALDALRSVQETGEPFELVLMDWKMPRMDGIETIRRIHNSTEFPSIPQILMISAYDRTECRRQSRNLGLAGFLVKPITPASLREALTEAFENGPAVAVESEEPMPREPLAGDLHGARVLLVEDNRINQMVATELLKMLGVEPTIADNGREAVEAVRDHDFDLVLMDIQMPVMDGLTAAKEIRALPKPGMDTLPILAMTAHALDTDYRKSLDSGMNDHLTKPIDPDKLRKALETWIVR